MIASRNRPRTSKYPWPIGTGQKSRANFSFTDESRVGPLPMPAIMEMIYRVRHWRFTASVDIEYPDINDPDDPPAKINETLAMDVATSIYTPDESTEIDAFRNYRGSNLTTTPVISTSPPQAAIAMIGGLVGAAFDLPHIIEDEFGLYWLAASFGGTVVATDQAYVAEFTNVDPDGVADNIEIAIDLVLNSGTYPIRGFAVNTGPQDASLSNASMTLAAESWHSYGGRYNVDTGNLV